MRWSAVLAHKFTMHSVGRLQTIRPLPEGGGLFKFVHFSFVSFSFSSFSFFSLVLRLFNKYDSSLTVETVSADDSSLLIYAQLGQVLMTHHY